MGVNEHRWGMARTWVLTPEQATAIANGESFEAEGDGETSGPGCLTCMQPYANAKDLPCPGRIWGDEDDPRNQALDHLPRAERRSRQHKERRRRVVSNGSTAVILGEEGPPIDGAAARAISRAMRAGAAPILEGEGTLLAGLAYDLAPPERAPRSKFTAPQSPAIRRTPRTMSRKEA